MRTTVLACAAAAGVLLAGVPVLAHHAFSAEFDINRPVTLEGTIIRMDWINPHAWIHLDVTEDDGSVSSWMIELGPPNSLIKRGWTRDSVPAGIRIKVDGYRAIDGALRANGGDITLPDGSLLFAGGSSPDDPENGN